MFDLIPYALVGALSLGVGGFTAAPAIADKFGSSSSSSSSYSSSSPFRSPSQIEIHKSTNPFTGTCRTYASGLNTCKKYTPYSSSDAYTRTSRNPLTRYNSNTVNDGRGNGRIITQRGNERPRTKYYYTY